MRDGSYGNKARGCGKDPPGLGQGPTAGSCEHGNEFQDSIKRGEFLDQVNDYKFFPEGLCSVEIVCIYSVRVQENVFCAPHFQYRRNNYCRIYRIVFL
jgi:hypothetical protein